MQITREGSRRWRGTTDIVKCKPSKIKDLEIKFSNVKDFNSSRTHHDYTVTLSDEELDQLLDERLKRFRRDIRARIVELKDAKREPADDELLRQLLDQYTYWCAASSRSRRRRE